MSDKEHNIHDFDIADSVTLLLLEFSCPTCRVGIG